MRLILSAAVLLGLTACEPSAPAYIAACQQTVRDYAVLRDEGPADQYADLFTEDGTFDIEVLPAFELDKGEEQDARTCNQAIEYANSGKTTCIISNGDANVFGMATLIVELIDEKNLWDEIELISLPGVTSFLAAASKVGAPVSGDFAIISLSDRLTDINLIDKRVKSALECDFVIGVYNPKSKKRIKPYQNFLARLSEVGERIAIIAQNVGRDDKEDITITTTTELIVQDIQHEKVGMNTIIIICNSNSKLTSNGLVLTPRGYLNKYDTTGELK